MKCRSPEEEQIARRRRLSGEVRQGVNSVGTRKDNPLGWTTDRTSIGGPSHLVLKRGTPEYTQRAMGLRDDPFRCPGQIRWYCTMSCRPKKSSVAIFRSFVTGTSMEVPKNITAMAHRSQRIRSSLSHGIQVSFKYLDKIFMCHNL